MVSPDTGDPDKGKSSDGTDNNGDNNPRPAQSRRPPHNAGCPDSDAMAPRSSEQNGDNSQGSSPQPLSAGQSSGATSASCEPPLKQRTSARICEKRSLNGSYKPVKSEVRAEPWIPQPSTSHARTPSPGPSRTKKTRGGKAPPVAQPPAEPEAIASTSQGPPATARGSRFVCPCPGCDYNSDRAYNVTRHFKTEHSLLKSPKECCGRILPTLYDRALHRKQVHPGGYYPCHVCGKVLNRRSLLKRHELVHTGERPHLCKICGVGFSSTSNLRRHELQVHQNRADQTPTSLQPVSDQTPTRPAADQTPRNIGRVEMEAADIVWMFWQRCKELTAAQNSTATTGEVEVDRSPVLPNGHKDDSQDGPEDGAKD